MTTTDPYRIADPERALAARRRAREDLRSPGALGRARRRRRLRQRPDPPRRTGGAPHARRGHAHRHRLRRGVPRLEGVGGGMTAQLLESEVYTTRRSRPTATPEEIGLTRSLSHDDRAPGPGAHRGGPGHGPPPCRGPQPPAPTTRTPVLTATISEPGFSDLDEATYHADKHLASTLGRSLLSSSGAKAILDCRPLRVAARAPVVKDAFDLGRSHTLPWAWARHRRRRRGGLADERGEGPGTRHATPAGPDPRRRLRPVAALGRCGEGIRSRADLRPSKAARSGPCTGSTTRPGSPAGAASTGEMANALIDLKTAVTAAPQRFSRSLVDYGYALQAAWYQDGYEALTGERLPFVHVVVEKEPPHLVAMYQVDADAWPTERIGRVRRGCSTRTG